MKKLSAVFFLLLFPCSLFSNDCDVGGVRPDAPVLCGNAVQGGFLYGESDWAAGGAENGGVFVIGIPMDAPDKLRVKFRKNGAERSYDYKIAERKYKEQRVSVDPGFVHYPPEIQTRIDSENRKIESAREPIDKSFLEFLDWKYPFSKKYPVTGVYGSRRVFNGQPKSPHKGFDIAAPKGTPVRAIGNGRVVLVLNAYLSGKTVFISHGYGIFSAYLHLDKTSVRAGDIATTKTVVGTVGMTGRASGPHLHLGLYHNQTPLDPELVIGK